MALYSYTIGAQGESQPIAPGCAVCVPFTLAAGQRLDIDLVHPYDETNQDFSLRGWISTMPVGSPDPTLPLYIQTWQPNRVCGHRIVCFHDPAVEADTPFSMPAAAGNYFINVLNLCNEPNQFSLTIVDTTATGDNSNEA